MKFVIAEKPAVAKSIAAVLGAGEKRDGYMEGNGYIVSWCVGHLPELAEPQAYDERYAKWRYEDLPILPETWKYTVPKDKKKQLSVLCRLMRDKRVDSISMEQKMFDFLYGKGFVMKKADLSSDRPFYFEPIGGMKMAKDKTPLYRHPAVYAREHGELEQYRASYKANLACKKAIEDAISEHYRDNVLSSESVRQVMAQFEPDRIAYILAVTVREKDWDGRISRDNKAWAKTVPVYHNPDGFGSGRNIEFVVDRPHPALLDSFVTDLRNQLSEKERTSVREQLSKAEAPSRVSQPKVKKEQER